MAIPARPKKSLEPAATLKVVGASSAEASTAIAALGATADDVECPNDVRSKAVFYRRALQNAVNNGSARDREEAVAAASALAQANV